MELQDFVRNVLVSVNNAVDEARQETTRDIRFSENNNLRTIEFDIAISVEDNNTKSGKGGVKVLQVAEVNAGTSYESKSSTVSRIVFGLEIDTLTKTEEGTRNTVITYESGWES